MYIHLPDEKLKTNVKRKIIPELYKKTYFKFRYEHFKKNHRRVLFHVSDTTLGMGRLCMHYIL